VLADPAPPVDRHERALSQEIDGLTSDPDGGAAARRWEPVHIEESSPALEVAETQGRYSPPDDATVTAVAALGAWPLHALTLGDPPGGGALEALLETLPQAVGVGSEDIPAMLAEADPGLASLTVALAMPWPAPVEEHPLPDNLTVACGFALVLGLSYGPLLPDLLAVVQARSSPWRRVLPAALKSRCQPGLEWI
jgi:hypothetical protein